MTYEKKLPVRKKLPVKKDTPEDKFKDLLLLDKYSQKIYLSSILARSVEDPKIDTLVDCLNDIPLLDKAKTTLDEAKTIYFGFYATALNDILENSKNPNKIQISLVEENIDGLEAYYSRHYGEGKGRLTELQIDTSRKLCKGIRMKQFNTALNGQQQLGK